MKRASFLTVTLILACLSLASCGTPRIIDTACQSMPQGTAHPADTITTKRWMLTYETNRQQKCL